MARKKAGVAVSKGAVEKAAPAPQVVGPFDEMERWFDDAFSRSLVLPAEVDDSKTKASMKDGMLELTLPKVEKAKRRNIKID